MSKTKYYFKDSDSETCKTICYFNNYMKKHNLSEMDVFEAIHENIGGGIFWCRKHSFCGDGTGETCGKENCNDYSARNKKSGVCIHHTHWLYTFGKKITIKLET